MNQQDLAVASGHWPLIRFSPSAGWNQRMARSVSDISRLSRIQRIAEMDTTMEQASRRSLEQDAVSDFSQLKPGWIIAFGVLLAVLGAFALASVVTATIASVYFVAISMVMAGIAQMMMAFQSRTFWSGLAWFLTGVFYSAAGLLASYDPLLAATGLTLFLGIALVSSGTVRLVIAFQMRSGTAWGWVVLSALVTAVLGIAVLAQWPASGLYVLGTFLSIDLLFAGATWLALGSTLLSRQMSAGLMSDSQMSNGHVKA
jgi:uncharacterized membrane protein HdeD (DUF308 family)